MKSLFLATLLIVGCLSSNVFLGTDAAYLTSTVDGAYEQNSLADPTNVITCYNTNATLSTELFNEVTTVLAKASTGKLSDLLALVTQVQDFAKTLPAVFGTCVEDSSDVVELEKAFGLYGKNISETKLITWVTFHLAEVNKQIKAINDFWVAGNYKSAGNQASILAHEALKNQEFYVLGSDAVDLTATVDGAYEQNSLADPTNVITCYNTNATLSTELFNEVTTVLAKASTGKLSDLLALVTQVQDFAKTLPAAFGTCVEDSSDVVELEKAFGLYGKNISETKLITWVTFHLAEVNKQIKAINDFWVAGNYKSAGTQLSILAHEALKNQE